MAASSSRWSEWMASAKTPEQPDSSCSDAAVASAAVAEPFRPSWAVAAAVVVAVAGAAQDSALS